MESWLSKLIATILDWIRPKPDPPPPPPPVYVVTEGRSITKRMKLPCNLEFDVTGVTDLKDKANLVFGFVDDFSGGGYARGEMQMRLYKCKIRTMENVVREPRYQIGWDPALTYHVKVAYTRDEFSFSIGPAGTEPIRVKGLMPVWTNLGIGWPPQGRPGVKGAEITNIVWTGTEV